MYVVIGSYSSKYNIILFNYLMQVGQTVVVEVKKTGNVGITHMHMFVSLPEPYIVIHISTIFARIKVYFRILWATYY